MVPRERDSPCEASDRQGDRVSPGVKTKGTDCQFDEAGSKPGGDRPIFTRWQTTEGCSGSFGTSSGSVITARMRIGEPHLGHSRGAPGRVALVHLGNELGPCRSAVLVRDRPGRFFRVGLHRIRSLQVFLLPPRRGEPDHMGFVRPFAL
jgi:hypothetical protein